EAQTVHEERPNQPDLIDRVVDTAGRALGYLPGKARELAERAAKKKLDSALGVDRPRDVDPHEEANRLALEQSGVRPDDARRLAGDLSDIPKGLSEHGTYAAGITAQQIAELEQARLAGKALERVGDELEASRGTRRPRSAPAPENYRGRYNAARAAEGKARLPE